MNEIITGDARELSHAIPDNSIDLIFTDPPYHKQYLHLYEWLAVEASRVLKPGGFLLTYAGNVHKYDVMHYLVHGQLTYFWDYITVHSGMGTMVWNRKTVARHKSILAFVKGEGKPRTAVLGLWTGTGSDKRYHTWGQDESTARYYIDCFSSSGDLIWEPFAGGGTTLVACKVLGRNFIAYEICPEAAEIARKRLEITQPLLPSIAAEQGEIDFCA